VRLFTDGFVKGEGIFRGTTKESPLSSEQSVYAGSTLLFTMSAHAHWVIGLYFCFVDFMTEKRVNEIYVGHKVVNDYYVANSH